VLAYQLDDIFQRIDIGLRGSTTWRPLRPAPSVLRTGGGGKAACRRVAGSIVAGATVATGAVFLAEVLRRARWF